MDMDLSGANLHKVALLIASLDRESADRVLDEVSPETAAAVRQSLRTLDRVDPQAQERVIREFIAGEAGCQLGRERRLDTRDALPRPSNGARSPGAQLRSPARPASGTDGPLERASERLIAECLSDELPQAIAVALSQLPAQRASEVVAHLPATQQTEVLERLVELDPASSLDFPEIRDEFQLWLSQQIERSLHRADLASRLATILDATHAGTRQRILSNVSSSDARLAKELQHQLTAAAHELA